MKELLYCTIIILALGLLPVTVKSQDSVIQKKGITNTLLGYEKQPKKKSVSQKRTEIVSDKVFKNTIHSVEGSSLKIGRIIALFVFCGLGAVILLFALI